MKVAVVGTGSIGRRHMANLLKLGLSDIVAVSEYSEKKSVNIDGTELPAVTRYDDVLSSDIDAVVIGNPTSLHLDYLNRALTAGKHVFLEKPASISSQGLDEAVAKVRAQGLVVAMGTMYRFNARLESLRERVERGDCGTILAVETLIGEHIADYHPEEDYRESYTARAELGGGVLLTQIHQVDWLNWIFGPFDKAFAVGGHRSDLEINVEDTVSYLLSGAEIPPAYGHLNYMQRPKRAGMTVTGTKGRLEWDVFAHTLHFDPNDLNAESEVEKTPYDRNDMFVRIMHDFLGAIKNGSHPRSDISDGRTALCVVDAIKRSMKSGEAEQIEP